MRRLVIIASFIIFLLPTIVGAYVSPGNPQGFVNDFAQVLSADVEARFGELISNLRNKTGDQIAIVTVSSLGDETIESYATKLFEEWGIGEKGKDNGLLMLVAPNERKVRIEVGYGLEHIVTDALSSRIIQERMVPLLKVGDYTGAINSALSQITSLLNSEASVHQISGGEKVYTKLTSVQWFVPVTIVLGLIVASTRWWFMGGFYGLFLGLYFYDSMVMTLFFICFGLGVGVMLSFMGIRGVFGLGAGGSKGGSGGGFGGGRSGGGGASGSW